MKYTAWVDYPTMTIAIERLNPGFKCTKFVDGVIVRGATKTILDSKELLAFLKTLPGGTNIDYKKELADLKL
jgi:hypothetical protein